MLIELKLELQSYIGDPYWPEMERVVSIQKESGMNRARTGENRNNSLEQHLRAIDMSRDAYDELEAMARRPFHVDDSNNVIIPKNHVDGMLVSACTMARSAMRPCPPDMVRTVLRASAWRTSIKADQAKLWERYVVVTGGTGQKLSNQRGLRSNYYIGSEPPGEMEPTKQVTATGTIDVNQEMVKIETLGKSLEWAGQWVGIGASRKMGWGRFNVIGFKPAK